MAEIIQSIDWTAVIIGIAGVIGGSQVLVAWINARANKELLKAQANAEQSDADAKRSHAENEDQTAAVKLLQDVLLVYREEQEKLKCQVNNLDEQVGVLKKGLSQKDEVIEKQKEEMRVLVREKAQLTKEKNEQIEINRELGLKVQAQAIEIEQLKKRIRQLEERLDKGNGNAKCGES